MKSKKMKFGELFVFEKKSGIKAGEGLIAGQYKFYTSSTIQSKYIDKYLFNAPALIFGTGGLASIHFCDEPFAVSTDCVVATVINKKQLNPKFVYYFLLSNIYLLEKGFKGAGLKHISKTYICNLDIPIFDISIQNYIVGLLDKSTMVLKGDQELILKYNELNQSVFYEMFGDPLKNSAKWEYTTLGNNLKFITSGSRGWAKYYSLTGKKFLRINNVGKSELLLKDLVYVNSPDSAESTRTKVATGDILFSITADLGRTAVIPKNFGDAHVNQHLAILRVNENKLNPYFVSQFLSGDGGKAQVLKVAKGGVKAGLNFNDIRGITIMKPPIELQNKFAKIVANLDLQKALLKEQLNHSTQLYKSLIQNYMVK